MPRIAPIHWKTLEAFLFFCGCVFVREHGDHRIYRKPGLSRPLVIPKKADIGVDIIKNNLRTLGVSREEYVERISRM